MWDYVLISSCVIRIIGCCFLIFDNSKGYDLFIFGFLLLFPGFIGVLRKSVLKFRVNKTDSPKSALNQSGRKVTKEDSDPLKVDKGLSIKFQIVFSILTCGWIFSFIGYIVYFGRGDADMVGIIMGALLFYPGLIGVILSKYLVGKNDPSKSKSIWKTILILGCVLCLYHWIIEIWIFNRWFWESEKLWYIGELLISFGLIGFTYNNRSNSATIQSGSENHDGMQPVGENTKENSDQLEAVPVQKPITYKNNFSSDGMRSGISPEPPETKKIQNDPSLRPEKNQQMQDRKTEGIKVCKYCGHQYEPGETFCPDCGAVETEIKM